jgi:hypothetical protein
VGTLVVMCVVTLTGVGRRQRRRVREHRERAAAGIVVGDPRTLRLAELAVEARRAQLLVDEEIDRLARRGVGWPVMAAVLGVSRQAVRQRHQRRTAATSTSASSRTSPSSR